MNVIWSTKMDGPDPNKIGTAVQKILKERPPSTIMAPSPTPAQKFPARTVVESATRFFSTTFATQYASFEVMREVAQMCNDRTTGYGVVNGLITIIRKIALPDGGDEERQQTALKNLDAVAEAIGRYKTTLSAKIGYSQALACIVGYAVGLLIGEIGPTNPATKNS